MKLTLDVIKKLIPNNRNPQIWLELANEYLPQYDITTPERIAGFFSQAGHESSDLNVLSENLNYAWDRLRVVFPRYFKTDDIAKQYNRNPQKIANHVYDDANRVNKIGNTQDGDGWRFRGRGIFQLTGRTNYTAFATSVNMTPEQAADFLQTNRGAFESACWFWQRNNLNRFADAKDIHGMSRAVNGGRVGLQDRINRWNRNLPILRTLQAVQEAPRGLQVGLRGDDVKSVQLALGFTGRDADGIYGRMTEAAVLTWQRHHKLIATGRLTPTQIQMLLS